MVKGVMRARHGTGWLERCRACVGGKKMARNFEVDAMGGLKAVRWDSYILGEVMKDRLQVDFLPAWGLATDITDAGLEAAERIKRAVDAAVSVRHILSHPGHSLPNQGEVQAAVESLLLILQTAAAAAPGDDGCRSAAAAVQRVMASQEAVVLPHALFQRHALLQAFRIYEDELNPVLERELKADRYQYGRDEAFAKKKYCSFRI